MPQLFTREAKISFGLPHYRLTVFLHANISVQETSKIFEALQRLEHRGVISYSLKNTTCVTRPPCVLLVRAEDGVGRCREFAIDLMDQRDLVDLNTLDSVAIYFKRSFWPEALGEIAAPLRGKIQPFGLNNPSIGLRAAMKILGSRFREGRKPQLLARDTRQLLAILPFNALDRQKPQEAEPLVLYQTRVWEDHDADVHAINEQRCALVRTLRRRLGDRFIGGIIPTVFARRQYPDVLTTLPFSMRSYSSLLRRASVGVYSEGLHQSIAFKMSEYLASQCCLVADRVGAVLPRPLEEGRHFLKYEDPDSCVDQCERLLADRQLAAEMRRNNWNYYCMQIEPGAQLLSALKRTFDV